MLSVTQLRFDVRTQTPLSVPAYKGSTLRGAFGKALHGLAQERGRYAFYEYLFNTRTPRDSARMASCRQAPRPYVIEPPLDARLHYNAGEPLSFTILLLGKAGQYVPDVIRAVERMGRTGIGEGARSAKQRGRFAIDAVHQTTRSIGLNIVATHAAPLHLTFETPLSLTFNRQPEVRVPEFHILIRNLLRRVANVAYFHCDTTMELDFRGLVEQATAVRLITNNTLWHDWERYSSRQRRRVPMAGLVGSAIYEGELTPFVSLLHAGAILHVGRNTVCGLGKYRVEEINDGAA